MIAIKLVDARRGLNIKCRELFNDEKIAESIYRYLCDGIEECDDVEPERKHGEWIDDGGLYRCSSCNHLWSELWWTENCPIERMLKIMPYCPNCGASMDGGKEDA